MDNQKGTLLVLLDISAEFITVDHVLFLEHLKYHFGATETARLWFESYLSKRKQYVIIGTSYSQQVKLKWVMPQGSVLGPVIDLYCIYTTPLGAIICQYDVRYETVSVLMI